MKKSLLPKTLTVQDLINKQRNPNYKGNKNKVPETGPLRPNKPAIYNTKNVSNPVIDKTVADKINGVEKTQPWVPEY
jgi:hypothetical protein